MNIIESKLVLTGEILKFLEESKKDRDLTYIEEKLYKFLKNIKKINYETEKKIYEELKKINIPEEIRIKIIDMLPQNEDELKVILYTYTLSKKEMEEILKIIKKYI